MSIKITRNYNNLHTLLQPFVGRVVVGASLPSGEAVLSGFGPVTRAGLDLDFGTGRLEVLCFTFGGAEHEDYLRVRTQAGTHDFWWDYPLDDDPFIDHISGRDGVHMQSRDPEATPEWLGPNWREAPVQHVLKQMGSMGSLLDVRVGCGCVTAIFQDSVVVVTRCTGVDMRPMPITQTTYVRAGTHAARMLPEPDDD